MLTTLKWILSVATLIALTAGALYVVAGFEAAPLTDEARAQAPGAFIELSAGEVHYRWDGPEDGPVIVMVHGFATPNFVFEQNAKALGDAGFRVLRFDHFGRGWSDRPKGPYDIEFYDRALLDLVDGLDLTEPFGLVGLSMGGPIVAEFTARRPERVSRVFLLVPAGFEIPSQNSLGANIIKTPIVGDWIYRMFGTSLMRSYYAAERPEEPANRIAGDPEVQMTYRGYGEALLSTLRHFPMTGREATFEQLSATRVPVFALFGALDETVDVASAEQMRAILPAAEIEVMEDADHNLNFERHGEVNPKLVEWFSGEEAPELDQAP